MTYNTLVNQVKEYLNRQDAQTISEIPNFIYQAEQRICRESKSVGLELYVTGTFTPNVSILQKPARWRRNISLSFGSGLNDNVRNQLTLRSYEFVRNYWPDTSELAAPKFYCDYGYDNLLVAPTPDLAYPFEYSYLQLPNPLTINNQTNWLTNYVPDVLLYATLLEAIPFVKNDERIPIWQAMYDRGLESLNNQDDQRTQDRTSNRGAD
jgi:hypothetical protein